MAQPLWTIHKSNTPLVATAIHNGHKVRREVADLLALSEIDRLREEDPFTGRWTAIAETRIVVYQSRFEMDLNRPREKAVYLAPEDAWGLQVWRDEPPAKVVAHSLAQYDAFYAEVQSVFTDLTRRFGRFVVFDLHNYNHRRQGPDDLPADPAQNPEVNIGTGSMDRNHWASIVNRFMADLKAFDFFGRSLDVRENIKFRGGHFSQWIHKTFPESACALAIEFKKFFMDEWSGEPDQEQLNMIRLALQSTIPGVLEEMNKL
jgi:hypothetical protein